MLTKSNLKDLRVVRDKIVRKFIRKSEKHRKFSEWFAAQDPRRAVTRSIQTKYKPVTCRQKIYEKTPIPVMTAIANQSRLGC